VRGLIAGRRAAAVAGVVLAIGVNASPSYAAHNGDHGRPKPWPACPHGHARLSYPPRSCHVETDRTSVPPGARFNVFGLGFRPGEQVVISSGDMRLETVAANKDGAVLTSAVLPRDVGAGAHTLTMTGSSGNRVQGVITVKPQLAASTRAAHGSLPFSGPAAAIPLAAAGVMMLASGAVVMSMVRRRRRFLVDG